MSSSLIHTKPEKDDIEVLPSEGHGYLFDASTNEAMKMILGDDDDFMPDITVGRMSHGFDPSEFDLMARNRVYDTANETEGHAGDELDLMSESVLSEGQIPGTVEAVAGDDEIAPFTSPTKEFPVLSAAMTKFKESFSKPRVMRVDTEDSYSDYVSDKVIDDLNRRVTTLEEALEAHELSPSAHRAAFEAHNLDPHAHQRKEILGAMDAFAEATSPHEAAALLPQVPIDIPDFAKGKVSCFRDGGCVVVSIRFQAADGSGRVATMAAKPSADAEDVMGCAMRAGLHPVTVLGMLDEAMDRACGQKLLKEIAGAALGCQRRLDVLGMSRPILLGVRGTGSPGMAALMHTQQRADGGDLRAQREVKKLEGSQVGRGALAWARKRLEHGRKEKAKREYNFARRYADMAMVLG